MKLMMTAAVAVLTLIAAGAAAAQPGPGGKLRQACAADMQKFCPDKTGKERHDCMMANKDKLSDGCKTAAAEAMKARQEMKADKPQ